MKRIKNIQKPPGNPIRKMEWHCKTVKMQNIHRMKISIFSLRKCDIAFRAPRPAIRIAYKTNFIFINIVFFFFLLIYNKMFQCHTIRCSPYSVYCEHESNSSPTKLAIRGLFSLFFLLSFSFYSFRSVNIYCLWFVMNLGAKRKEEFLIRCQNV